ncbi:MAG: hypothetical protein AAF684_03285 [Pseudomonadota bacterium]
MESVALQARVSRLQALRRSVIAAARSGVRNLDVAEQAALERSIEDRLEEALDDEIAPLIDGLEAEAAAFTRAGEEGWAYDDRAGRSARILGG